ncbi:hypothetical protein HY285_03555 [Candidatus Peregrinibacteria bacterium]|nr:hypothetical protein [Candidatus Peregrinibacteria bacterium]MBI3816592.1 hypothetical protein [Candidatus Peregrinibacteria bacterium]
MGIVTKKSSSSAKHRLTVNGFTPEFEAEVLRAAKEEEGSVSFDNAADAIAYLHSLNPSKKRG